MALGIAIKNITTEKSYSLEEFYNAIKDKQFSAGVPSMTKHGFVTIITFPELDRQNQVQIIKTGMSETSKKWCVQKAEAAGLGNMAGNMVLDKLTDGLFGFGRMFGNKSKECEKLVAETAKELKSLNL